MRTVQVLTSTLDPKVGSIELSVRTGPIEWEAEPFSNSWSGLSIGAGGPDIDYRRTALVHHMPAPDGGMLALVDPMGIVTLRDNEQTVGDTPTWSINRDITTAELPELLQWTRVAAATTARRFLASVVARCFEGTRLS